MPTDADIVMESRNEEPEKLTLWSDDHLQNIQIYDCGTNKRLLSDIEALDALDVILRTLKSGCNVDSLGQCLVTACLYASRARENTSKFLYVFHEANYPEAKFIIAPELDFESLVSSFEHDSKLSEELSKYYSELVAGFPKGSRKGILAAYVGFVAGVLLRGVVKKPKTVWGHIQSKMNKNFGELYFCTTSLPTLPITEQDLTLIQTHIEPSCLWTKTIVFYSIGSRKLYSLIDCHSIMNNFHVFDAMHTNHFKYYHLSLIYLCLALSDNYRYSFDQFREVLITNPKVKPGLDKLKIFTQASYGRDETRIILRCGKVEHKNTYWPYCRIFDEKYFEELDSKNHHFLKMTFIKMLPSIDKVYDWSGVDHEGAKSFAATVLRLLREERLMKNAPLLQLCWTAFGLNGKRRRSVDEDPPKKEGPGTSRDT